MIRKALLFVFMLAFAAMASAQSQRHFIFHYDFAVRSVDAGKQLRVWIPLAHSDQFQTVKVTKINGDVQLKKTHENRFGNQMLYASAPSSTAERDYQFSVDYDVVRRERLTLTDADREMSEEPAASKLDGGKVMPAALKQYLAPDKLVPVSGAPAEIAAKTTAGRTGNLQGARAIYDYVFANMKYDKSGTGWGRGDSLWACDAKRGNCTDFHSLFISMARSQNIPSRFEIGFPLPGANHSGEITGYHCWAEFYLNGRGWIPVDISEAWKDPAKKDYFFGAHDANRIQFTMGRDLVLSPAQNGEPLNYFVYPYVEVGGKKYENVSNRFSFVDLTGNN